MQEDSKASLNIFLIPVSIILSGAMIMISIIISATAILDRDELITKSNLNAAITAAITNAGLNSSNPDSTSDISTEEFPQSATIFQNDPVLGNKDTAKVAIVEFSDYECPYCHEHFVNTYSALKSRFIDSGEVVLVFRDNPLYFHEPAASMKAMAAECVNEIGGNAKYFEYHDKLFTQYETLRNSVLIKSEYSTQINEIINKAYNTSEITGEEARKQILNLKDARNSNPLINLADSIGIDKQKFTDCIGSDKYRNEVLEDIADATKSGANGTPAFIVGPFDANGNVNGKLVSGTFPFESFAAIIEEYGE